MAEQVRRRWEVCEHPEGCISMGRRFEGIGVRCERHKPRPTDGTGRALVGPAPMLGVERMAREAYAALEAGAEPAQLADALAGTVRRHDLLVKLRRGEAAGGQ